uniref:Uncharacterized protein n=2 Tax=Ciona savignyi TaxID=51511 RepID=H2ZIR4_CIOSA
MKELKETLEMNAADTTIPSWKTELIQRKRAAQKNRAASEVTIPEWKRELLKRIHSKSEFSKSTMGEVEGDMDEHILKVSDNIFMRQEQTRKASIGLPSTKTKTKLPQVNVAPTPGYHVTRADNIVIIEREDEVLDSFTSSMKNDAGDHKDQDDIEMPSVGIVSRLKNKFKCKSETPKLQRALSTDIILSPSASEDLVKSPTSPNHPRTFSLPQRNGPLQNGPTSPKRDFTTPSSFKIGNTIHKVTSPRFKKIAPVKVDPITPAPTPKIDTSNLHAPGYIKPDEANSQKKFEKPTSPVRSPISSPTKQDSILLRSGSVESKPTSHTTPADPPRRLSLTRTANSPVRSKPIPITDIDGKENVPDIPERTTMAHTKPKISPKKSAFKPSSPEKQIKSNNENFEIRDLGKTSLDPSLLTSKAAII